MRKLADAEAARTAAEGRCQSAAKNQPGLGARLRKWCASERAKVQAALAEPASQPISANEHPKLEVDSTLKELERAKADAQNATASEALAHAEAALQRAKEETERATNEAQRAKADTQAARESEAAAKRKLADAEAARTVAEGRCQSAAKRQPGLGARLRKWFASERANPKNP